MPAAGRRKKPQRNKRRRRRKGPLCRWALPRALRLDLLNRPSNPSLLREDYGGRGLLVRGTNSHQRHPTTDLQMSNIMAEISASAVAKLREMTNAGMMDCKKALTEAQGNLDAAIDILRKRGAATANTKGTREAREGVIAQYIAPDGRLGVLVEVNCETDFVARNEMFRAFADEVAKRLANDPQADLEADRVSAVAKIRENIKIPRH